MKDQKEVNSGTENETKKKGRLWKFFLCLVVFLLAILAIILFWGDTIYYICYLIFGPMKDPDGHLGGDVIPMDDTLFEHDHGGRTAPYKSIEGKRSWKINETEIEK